VQAILRWFPNGYKTNKTCEPKKGEKKLVGRKSSEQDKGEGTLDKAKGKAKEAAGAVTGDKAQKSEGRSDQTKGTAKEKKGKLKDVFK
jgi:uncharacterized protein YjbJ (UPF0337 family)